MNIVGKAGNLRFREDGTFRIMQIADTQDTQNTSKDTVAFISAALDEAKPDLVVFSGDQLKGYGFSFSGGDIRKKVEKAITNLVKPMQDRNIPFTFVFGNHDDRAFSISKAEQFDIYKQSSCCIAERGDENLEGYANHYVPILSADGSKIAFAVYLVDSLSTKMNGICGAVTKEQIAWYQGVREALCEENGGYVPSMVFQHIPVPEMWELLKEVPKSTKPHAVGYRSYAGKFYTINEDFLQKGNCDFLLETPATPPENGGEFEAMAEKGDVLAMFFGHDHNNSFVGKYKNMLLGYTQGCGFNVYGPGWNRGVRIVDLNENNPCEFSTHTLLYTDVLGKKDVQNKLKFALYTYAPPSVESVMPTLKKAAVAAGILALCGVGYGVYKYLNP